MVTQYVRAECKSTLERSCCKLRPFPSLIIASVHCGHRRPLAHRQVHDLASLIPGLSAWVESDKHEYTEFKATCLRSIDSNVYFALTSPHSPLEATCLQ